MVYRETLWAAVPIVVSVNGVTRPNYTSLQLHGMSCGTQTVSLPAATAPFRIGNNGLVLNA
jgi:hypothetical protein